MWQWEVGVWQWEVRGVAIGGKGVAMEVRGVAIGGKGCGNRR